MIKYNSYNIKESTILNIYLLSLSQCKSQISIRKSIEYSKSLTNFIGQ